jgi:hypothetical protein
VPRIQYAHNIHSIQPIHFPYAAVNSNAMFPPLVPAVPPTHSLLNGLFPHTALAALMHASHLPFDTLIVDPWFTTFSFSTAVPDAPVVEAGLPWHFWIVPAMVPQMERMATLMSWLSMELRCVSKCGGARGKGRLTRQGRCRL